MAGPIRIAILANAAQAKRELQSTEKAAGAFGRGMGKVGALAKAGFAAAAIGAGILAAKTVAFGKESIQAASELEQSTGAVEAIFGKQAAGIKTAAETAAEAFGLSKNSYQELASVLGAGLKNQGLTDYADKTKQVIGLGADLAAQFGGSTKDAVEAISSLMRGEADPIERYGVSIKQSAINAELAAKGQDKLTGAARTQAEATARLKLLFDQTKNAQGTFARESDTLAGKQQRNAAAWENLKAKMGGVFLPVAGKVQEFLANRVLPVVEKVFGWIEKNAPAALEAVKGFLNTLKGDGTSTQFLDYVKTAFATILPIVKDVWGAIQAAWPAISEALKSLFAALKELMGLVKLLWGLFGPAVVAQVKNVFTTIFGVVSGVMKIVAGVIKTVTAVIRGDWKAAWDGIKQIFAGVWQVIKSIVTGAIKSVDNTLGGGLSKMWGLWKTTWANFKTKIGEIWAGITSTIKTKISEVKTKIGEIKSKVTGAFTGAGSWLKDAGRRIIQGLLDGINALIGDVTAKLNWLTDKIPDWKGPRSRDARLLYGAGKAIMRSLVTGLGAGEHQVQQQLAGLTDYMQGAFDRVMSPTLTPALTVTTAGRGAGTVQYISVEVKVDRSMSPAEVGRQIKQDLDAYARAGGR